MKKILILTDFSTVSNYALHAAIEIAEKQDADLIIYHALDEDSQLIYELDSDPELMVYQRDTYSNDMSLTNLRKLLVSKNIDANLVIGAADASSSFQSVCDDFNPDLIVMGATGMGQNSDAIGSRTKSLIKAANQPVLVVKSPMKDFDIKKIVFASKFDKSDTVKFRKSIQVLDLPQDALIHLMSVDTSSFFMQPSVLMQQVMKDFEVIAYPIKAVSTFYKDYNVKAGIEHFLNEVSPDILVMTNSDGNFLKRLFQPNAALESAISSSYPVLIMN